MAFISKPLRYNVLILEQLAWIFVIHDIDYKKQNYFKIKPSSCIVNLKKAFPESGRLYGLLSKTSHIEPKETLKYIRPERDDLYIVMRSSMLSLRDALHLLYLADIFVVLSELVYADLISDWKNIIREADRSYSPNPDRELYKEIIV